MDLIYKTGDKFIQKSIQCTLSKAKALKVCLKLTWLLPYEYERSLIGFKAHSNYFNFIC